MKPSVSEFSAALGDSSASSRSFSLGACLPTCRLFSWCLPDHLCSGPLHIQFLVSTAFSPEMSTGLTAARVYSSILLFSGRTSLTTLSPPKLSIRPHFYFFPALWCVEVGFFLSISAERMR